MLNYSPKRRVRIATVGFAVVVLLTSTAASCGQDARPTSPEAVRIQAASLPRPDLRVLVLTDLDGYLEPCGCTSRPLGGIDRLAARVAALRADGVPTVMVAAGNLFFHGAPHGVDVEQARDQEIWRAQTIADVLGRLELAAAAPGPLDFGYGTDAFESLATTARFPLLAAGVELPPAEGSERAALVPSTLRQVGDLKVGIVGLSELAGPDGALPDRVTARGELRQAGRAAVQSLRAEGAQLVVALVQGDRRTARRLAGGIEGIDFVVQGGLDEATASPPISGEGAVVLNAARQGHGVTVVDVWRRGNGRWSDVSVWTREAQLAHLTQSIAELRQRVAEWEADARANADDIARQRTRLTRLEADAAALGQPATTEGNLFAARFDELGPEAPRDPAIRALVEGYDARVNEHNQRVFADWRPEPAPEGRPHYVGSQACASCHGAAVRWWRGTPHGRAYATLANQNKQFNLSCVGCHVTGYLQPGGSTVTHVETLQDVGCESCHGPGSMHVADPPGAAFNVNREPEESLCLTCHNPEHSDRFHFDTYRTLLIAPGHGQPPG